MSSLRDEISAALASQGLAPNKKLGQHFLIDTSALQCLLKELALNKGDRVLEIGPGTGVLTKRMLEQRAQVLAVELDRGMATHLQQADWASDLQLVHADALASKNSLHADIVSWSAAGPWQLGANLPYDVSMPLMLNCLALPVQPTAMVVTVQREAAERLCAAPGSGQWGASAAIAQAAGTGRIVRRLPPSSFMPRPRVDSAILRWDIQRPLHDGFARWVRDIFAFRRKRVTRALRHLGADREQAEQARAASDLTEDSRVEELDVDALIRLHQHYSKDAA